MRERSETGDDSPVVLHELDATGGRRVAVATLNAEKTLNSLSLPMIEILAAALDRWANDDRVAVVILTGAGDRAFCAGGDVLALHRSMRRNREAGGLVDDYADRFFEREYRLDHQLHRYPKPVVCVGHGIVMGGGLGLFSAARFRVVTEQSRIAMPEISIGLFPDAGATWILKHLSPALALFLAATGSPLNAADALHLGVATHEVSVARRDELIAALASLDWGNGAGETHIDECLRRFAPEQLPESVVREEESRIERALGARIDSARAASEAIGALRGSSPWIDRGIRTMERGCPTSLGIVVEQLARAGTLALADCFRLELVIATHCARNGDFEEGVRALLVDKDNAPRWRYPSVRELPREHVLGHFVPPWETHPLNDLD